MITQKQRLELVVLVEKYARACVDVVAARDQKEAVARFREAKFKLADYLERMTKS